MGTIIDGYQQTVVQQVADDNNCSADPTNCMRPTGSLVGSRLRRCNSYNSRLAIESRTEKS